MQGTQVWSLVQKIPRAAGQLSPCATATEPTHLRARDEREKPLQWEVHEPQLQSSPYSLQLEKSPRSNQDPAQPKINKTNKNGPFLLSWLQLPLPFIEEKKSLHASSLGMIHCTFILIILFLNYKMFWLELPWQWLGLCASTAGCTGSISGWGTRVPHTAHLYNVAKEKKLTYGKAQKN